MHLQVLCNDWTSIAPATHIHLSKDARLVLSQVVKQWAQTFGAVYSTHDADSQYVLVSDNANNQAVIFQPAGCGCH